MGFDVDAWRESREPWTYQEGGRVWKARPVSALVIADTLAGLDALDHRGQGARWRRVFRLAFPWSPLYLVLPQYDPVPKIMRLEPGPYQAVIVDFLVSLGIGPRPSALETSGTSSPTKTPLPTP